MVAPEARLGCERQVLRHLLPPFLKPNRITEQKPPFALARSGLPLVCCPSFVSHRIILRIFNLNQSLFGMCPVKTCFPLCATLCQRSLCHAGYLVLAFAAFPMPAVFPSYYWVFHSVWHVLLAAGIGPHMRVAHLLTWAQQPSDNVSGPSTCQAVPSIRLT